MLDWNSIYKSGRDFGVMPDPVVDMILTYTNPAASKTFLDIGCGTGQLTRALHERGYTGLGIDLSHEAVAIAKSKTNDITYKTFDIEKEDASTLGGPYGLITCKHVYAFIEDRNTFLEKVSKLLESDGVFILLTPLKDKVPEEKKNIAVDTTKLRNEVAQYFRVIEDRELVSGQLLILSSKE